MVGIIIRNAPMNVDKRFFAALFDHHVSDVVWVGCRGSPEAFAFVQFDSEAYHAHIQRLLFAPDPEPTPPKVVKNKKARRTKESTPDEPVSQPANESPMVLDVAVEPHWLTSKRVTCRGRALEFFQTSFSPGVNAAGTAGSNPRPQETHVHPSASMPRQKRPRGENAAQSDPRHIDAAHVPQENATDEIAEFAASTNGEPHTQQHETTTLPRQASRQLPSSSRPSRSGNQLSHSAPPSASALAASYAPGSCKKCGSLEHFTRHCTAS